MASSAETIKMVVIDNHTLGYLIPNSNYAGVLKASVLRGAPCSGDPLSAMVPVLVNFADVRPASIQDFKDFGVSHEGYLKDSIYKYEFAETISN